jgi:hypothetical protein
MTPEDWLAKDYELKVKYLTDEFQRMWTRFNFFLTLESALIGGKFVFGDGHLSRELGFVGAGLSAIWYIFGAEDRYLVRIYRKHVEDAHHRLMAVMNKGNPSLSESYVGETDRTALELREQDRKAPARKRFVERISGWRLDAISTTRLASLFPLLTLLVWVAVIAFCSTGVGLQSPPRR